MTVPAGLWGPLRRIRFPPRAALRAQNGSWALATLTGLLVVGGFLRLWLLLAWPPAILGFPDEVAYLRVAAAGAGPVGDVLHPIGYPLFLEALQAVGAGISSTIFVQHLLGMTSAVLLYATVRRAGSSAWAALVPALVVLLCGDVIFLEQTFLSETLFMFLSCAALYSTIRTADSSRDWAWASVAGLLVGLATAVRTVGVVLIPVVALWLLMRRPAGRDWAAWLRSLLPGVAAALVSVGFALAYAGWHQSSAGGFELTTNGAYILYGRVAPWANCHDFTPPAGTAVLCQSIPASKRPGAGGYIFGPSPGTDTFGPAAAPLAPSSAQKLQAFAIAAIEHQPLTYLWTIVEKFLRVVYPGVGTPGEGQTPSTFLPYISDPARSVVGATFARALYGGRVTPDKEPSAAALEAYDSRTHMDGLFMALLIVLAIASPFLAARRWPRRRAVLVSVFAFALLLTPLATVDYDYRYVLPAIGPLAAAAAVGAGGAWGRWLEPKLAPDRHPSVEPGRTAEEAG